MGYGQEEEPKGKTKNKGPLAVAMGESQYAPRLLDLIQFFLRGADLVKFVIFSDKAGALCGRLLKGQLCIEEEIGVFGLQISCCHPAIFWFDFNADAVPACSESSNHCGASSAKRVKHGIACERKHADEACG